MPALPIDLQCVTVLGHVSPGSTAFPTPLVLPEWEQVLSVAARLQRVLPGAVLVGGNAAAIHARHRLSRDAGHVLADFRARFNQALVDLESIAEWTTARVTKPVLVLESLDGVEIGVRRLIRKEPLETMVVDTPGGGLTVLTDKEILRIKGVLVLRREGPVTMSTSRRCPTDSAGNPLPGPSSASTRCIHKRAGSLRFSRCCCSSLGLSRSTSTERTFLSTSTLNRRWHKWPEVRAVWADVAGPCSTMCARWPIDQRPKLPARAQWTRYGEFRQASSHSSQPVPSSWRKSVGSRPRWAKPQSTTSQAFASRASACPTGPSA